MIGEIDDHVEGKILGLAIARREQSLRQPQAFCQSTSSPRSMHQCFEPSVSRSRVLVGAEIDTWPIHNHPDLPQVRLRVFDDPTCHLAHAAWWHCLHRRKWLEGVGVIYFGRKAFLDLLQRFFERVGIVRTW